MIFSVLIRDQISQWLTNSRELILFHIYHSAVFFIAVFVVITSLRICSLAAWQVKHLLALWGDSCFDRFASLFIIYLNSDETLTYKLDIFLSNVMKHLLPRRCEIKLCRDDVNARNCRTENILDEIESSLNLSVCLIKHCVVYRCYFLALPIL